MIRPMLESAAQAVAVQEYGGPQVPSLIKSCGPQCRVEVRGAGSRAR